MQNSIERIGICELNTLGARLKVGAVLRACVYDNDELEGGDSMKKKNCPNWDRIRSAYITGNDSPKECAKKHGVNYRTLGNHLFSERWNDQRAAYRGSVADKAIDTAKNCTAFRVASELTVLSHVVDALERELKKALEDGEQLHRYLVQTTTRHKDGVQGHHERQGGHESTQRLNGRSKDTGSTKAVFVRTGNSTGSAQKAD